MSTLQQLRVVECISPILQMRKWKLKKIEITCFNIKQSVSALKPRSIVLLYLVILF